MFLSLNKKAIINKLPTLFFGSTGRFFPLEIAAAVSLGVSLYSSGRFKISPLFA